MYTKAAVSLILVGYASAFSAQMPLALRKPPQAGGISMSAASNVARTTLVGALLISAIPVFAGDADAGEKVFNANCASCHAGGKNAVVADHTLEKSAIEKYLKGGFKESSVIMQVTNGKNAMPAFGGRLSEDDINNVASYVITTAEEGWE